jgi:hypothetical protein
MKRSLTLIFLLLAFAILALAHGKEQHVLGSVTKITPNEITVKTVKNEIVTIALTEKTEFNKGNTKATLNDLKVGDRVVIHAIKSGNKLQAHIVKFGVAPEESRGQHQHSQ